jgi:SAM-dependent methyltransferase
MEAVGRQVEGARILDVGCGYRFPITLLLHTSGARVTGIDVEPVARRLSLMQLREHFVRRGARAFTRRLVREFVCKGIYFRALERHFGKSLRFDGLQFRQARIEDLVGEGEYDIVFSNAAFEHIENVAGAVEIIARLLKPGGLAYVSMHLFPSLSGGHDLAWSVPETGAVALRPGRVPWQHLRDPHWKAPTYLNRLREHEYREIFSRHLRIRDWKVEWWEPDTYLTEEILHELPGYTREELLKRSVVVLAEKATGDQRVRC